MLYKNKKNVLKGVVAFVFMLTLSLSTALSPLAKAEEAKYTWKTLTSTPATSGYESRDFYISQDGSKLFILERDSNYTRANLWMSADDGATWRKIFSKQAIVKSESFSADGSKIVLGPVGASTFYISTDGGQSWVERGRPAPNTVAISTSPDGSFLTRCDVSGGATVFTIYISTDDGQTWIQKGTNSIGCPEKYIFNNGTMIATPYSINSLHKHAIARSTDYGQTWTETPGVLNYDRPQSFSNNGNYIFEGDRISLDGGSHWTPSNAPVPAGYTIVQTGISDDGKKLFVTTGVLGGASPHLATLLTSVDGGRTWHSENGANDYDMMAMSSDGSKMFYMYDTVYRVGTLTTPQPVTPGSGASGTVAPSTGSTSTTPGQKPGKSSGRLAETGTSTWTVGGLAAIAVAAGALVLRKRL